MCGEKSFGCAFSNAVTGSPPHVRGKAAIPARRVPADRITPACAGKSVITHDLAALCEDHPRMCGEKVIVWPSGLFTVGSPPHVRGKVRRWWVRCRCVRDHPRMCGEKIVHALGYRLLQGITPACAGKRQSPSCTTMVNGDHPRMCGEKYLERKAAEAQRGSPPHVRGKD